MRRWLVMAALAFAGTGCAAMGKAMFPELTKAMERQGQVEERYDQFRDERSWLLVPMHVHGDPMGARISGRGDDIQFGVVAIANGPEHPDRPNTFSLMAFFYTSSPSWRFLRSANTVDFILNGSERLHLGTAEHDGEVKSGYVTETMVVSVSHETLERIAGAESVVGQLRNIQFELTPHHLERMRAFLAAIPPVSTVASGSTDP